MTALADLVRSYLAEREGEALALLTHLARINSHTGNKPGIDAVGHVLEDAFEAAGLAVRVLPQPEAGDHLLALSPDCAEGGPRALLVGHMDTVFPQDMGFDEVIDRGNKLRGPGLYDMKGGLVAALYAHKALNACGCEVPVAFICNSDEETGSHTSEALIRAEARQSAFGLVFEGAGLDGGMVTGRRGRRGYELRVTGRAGHAGFAGAAKSSAVLELAHKTVALEALNDPERGVSVNVGVVRGGSGPNVIAAKAHARIDARFVRTDLGRELDERVRAVAAASHVPGVEASLEVFAQRPCMEQTEGNRALYAAAEEAGAALGLPVAEEFRPGVSDANFIADEGVPVLDGLGPCGARDHSPEEYIIKKSLVERTALAALTLEACWRRHMAGGLPRA